MSTINAYSAERTKYNASPQQLITPPELKGRMRISLTSYTWLSGYVDAGSTITGVPLPKGARVVGGYLVSQAGVAASTITVSLTDGTTTIVVGSDLAIGASAARHELPTEDSWHNVIGVDAGGLSPKLTTGGAAMVAGNKVALVLYYVVD